MGAIIDAGQFIIETAFDLYVMVVLLRILLQYFKVRFTNPIVQTIAQLTNPFVLPLQRLLPKIGSVDLAAVAFAIFLAMLKTTLLMLLFWGLFFDPVWMLLHGLGETLNALLNIFFFAIIMLVLLSWINPGAHNPLVDIIFALTTPLLNPVRRYIPSLGGIDLSPMVVIFVIILLRILFVRPLLTYS